MPEPPRPALSTDEVDAVRKWIVAGAPAFPDDVAKPIEEKKDPVLKDVAGVDYVLKQILADVRTLKPQDRQYIRYFSINHILTAGATPAALELHRDAFAKAINHLSWESNLVKPRAIDAPANSVFAVDIRQLGWHLQPFNKASGRSDLNLFDLALIDYPYGIAYDSAETFERLAEEFLIPTGQLRPVPYIRADWFVSVVTQPPLYEDMLQLPFEIQHLEHQLGVDLKGNIENGLARRAGMTVSGVSRNNRVVERHPARNTGYYWASIDYRTSKGPENMFKDPIHLRGTGGEFIFQLPNKLQGYFVATAAGVRLDAAPTDIVTDKFAADKTVRNGLACMRCHDQGMKKFVDTVRPALLNLPGTPGFDKQFALQLYAEQKEMDGLLEKDGKAFLGAMQELLGKPQKNDPLIPITRQFLDDPIHLALAAGELGLADAAGLKLVFKTPQFTALGLMPLTSDGVVRRDAWEDYFGATVRGLGLGVPVEPIDGLLRRDYPAGPSPLDVEFKTNKPNNQFEPGDELVVQVKNNFGRPIYVELIGTSTRGKKTILAPATTIVKPGETYRYPPNGGLKIRGDLGKEQVTLFACDEPFSPGVLLRGDRLTDRVVHSFYRYERLNGRLKLMDLPARLIKRTIEIETK
jgi:serine/threonine-protein kinase